MTTSAALTSESKSEPKPLKPVGLLASLFLFGIPAAALSAALLWLWPTLMAGGLERPAAYTLALGLVNIGLILAAVAGYLLEGNPLNWASFCQRMRFTSMDGRVWKWAGIGTLVFGLVSLAFTVLLPMFYKAINFTLPDITAGATTIWMNLAILILNIFGEELWWRGYILPRQELAFGKNTWMLHGALWACFHMFKWYAVPFMLISCQVIPFVAQRTKNTWPGVISHFVINGVGMLL